MFSEWCYEDSKEDQGEGEEEGEGEDEDEVRVRVRVRMRARVRVRSRVLNEMNLPHFELGSSVANLTQTADSIRGSSSVGKH